MDDIRIMILEKAKKRFNHYGFKKTTMDEIARDCRISKKTIYKHFKDKEDLFLSLIIHETLKGRKIINERLQNINDTMEWIDKFFRVSVYYFMEDNFLTNILREEDSQLSPFLSQKFFDMVEKDIITIIAEGIKDGKKKGELRDVDELVIAYACFKLFQSLSYARSNSLSGEKDKMEYYINAFIDFIKYGVAK